MVTLDALAHTRHISHLYAAPAFRERYAQKERRIARVGFFLVLHSSESAERLEVRMSASMLWSMEHGGGGMKRVGGLSLLDAVSGAVNGSTRGAGCGNGVDSVDEWPE